MGSGGLIAVPTGQAAAMTTPAVERAQPPEVMVKFANPVMRRLLASPLHRAVSGSLLLLHLTGRRTGTSYDIPVGYHQLDSGLAVFTSSGWKANVRGGAEVSVTMKGRRTGARAMLDEEPETVARAYEEVIGRLGWKPAQRRLGIVIHVERTPTRHELEQAARSSGLSVIRLQLLPG